MLVDGASGFRFLGGHRTRTAEALRISEWLLAPGPGNKSEVVGDADHLASFCFSRTAGEA